MRERGREGGKERRQGGKDRDRKRQKKGGWKEMKQGEYLLYCVI